MKNDFRFERKWVFKNIDKETLLLSLLSSKLFFIEQFNERVVNSIYFDTLHLKSAVDNLDGISDREKRLLGADPDDMKDRRFTSWIGVIHREAGLDTIAQFFQVTKTCGLGNSIRFLAGG